MEVEKERREYDYSRRGHLEDRVDDAEDDGGAANMEDADRDKEKSRQLVKHRSRDRKKEHREGADHGSKDRDRAREKDREEVDKDKSRDKRRRDERDDRERGRESSLERGHEKEKYKENDSDKDREMDRERSLDRDYERGRDRGKDRAREREAERERVSSRDHDRGKEKRRDHGRDRDKDREREKERGKGHDRARTLERDNKDLDKESERDRGKEKDYERGRGREKERDKLRESDKEKEKVREKDKGKGKYMDKHDKPKERHRDNEKEERHGDNEKEDNRGFDKERGESKEGGKDGKRNVDTENDHDIAKRKDEPQDELAALRERTGSKDYETSVSSRPSASELEERITKMKEERLKRKTDSSSEILSWVNRSRVIQEKMKTEKEKALYRRKALEEQDNFQGESDEDQAPEHAGKHLAGVKILHGLEKVLEGGAVVLTLKDQSILADGNVNEEMDMLENVEIGEQKKRDEAYRASLKTTGIYDDKFSNESASQKTILPQYDDPVENEGVILDESGRFSGVAEKRLEELRKRIQGGSINKGFEDLASSGKISSDYYTSEEMLQFKKPKKKKSLRKKEKLDLDALEAEAISSGVGIGDHGSRKDGRRQSVREEQEKIEAEARRDAYRQAIAKAEEASKALRLDQTLTIKTEEDENPVFGEDYEDLQKSLEQARKLSFKKQDESSASGPQAVALQALVNNENNQNSSAGDPQENKVVITEMEEFVLGLQINEETRKPELEDVFMDEDIDHKPMEIVTQDESRGSTEVDEVHMEGPSVNDQKEDIVLDETIHEVAVGKGLSGALKLLKERGTLKETVEWGGRNMDKKKSKLVGIHENEGPKEIHIERTDEFGRTLTPKEAFRIISHKFHGKGPGKMKQEKRMKQYQEELKLKQMEASDTPSHAMERMRETQALLRTPYLVLSGNVKPGQTSDPSSGFATVEKDHFGGLTPMLGDRKVEHFLGIKRKDEPGRMAPPPPMKPKN